MDREKLMKNLKARRFNARYFETGAQAAECVAAEIRGKKVVFGGSVTLKELGLYEKLSEHNEVYWHWVKADPAQRKIESEAEVYLCSANAVAETGEIVNIDGNGNRVSTSVYGPETTYFIVGINKIAPDLPSAIERARSTAAPPNVKRLNIPNPCTVDGKCHDCKAATCICNIMTILMGKPGKMKNCEIILVGEPLGY